MKRNQRRTQRDVNHLSMQKRTVRITEIPECTLCFQKKGKYRTFTRDFLLKLNDGSDHDNDHWERKEYLDYNVNTTGAE